MRKKIQQGLGLVELMVSLVITLIIGVVIASMFSYLTHQNNRQKDVADIERTMRTALFIMSRDIANAGYMLRCSAGNACSSLLNSSYLPAAGTAVLSISTANDAASKSTGIATKTLTLNYAAPAADDPVSISYSNIEDSDNSNIPSLRRTQTNRTDTAITEISGEGLAIATNVLDFALSYGVSDGAGGITYSSSVPTDTYTLRSIRLGLLVRSPFPDQKYQSPANITWLGGTYAVPTTKRNYRHDTVQQEIFMTNLGVNGS